MTDAAAAIHRLLHRSCFCYRLESSLVIINGSKLCPLWALDEMLVDAGSDLSSLRGLLHDFSLS